MSTVTYYVLILLFLSKTKENSVYVVLRKERACLHWDTLPRLVSRSAVCNSNFVTYFASPNRCRLRVNLAWYFTKSVKGTTFTILALFSTYWAVTNFLTCSTNFPAETISLQTFGVQLLSYHSAHYLKCIFLSSKELIAFYVS